MYVTTDKELFSRWLSDLAGKAIETSLQRQRQHHLTQRESCRMLTRRPEHLERTKVSEFEAHVGIDPAAAGLPMQQRIVLALRNHGLTYEEIASNLGIPVGTVHSRLFRARRRMTNATMTRRYGWPTPVQDNPTDDPLDQPDLRAQSRIAAHP